MNDLNRILNRLGRMARANLRKAGRLGSGEMVLILLSVSETRFLFLGEFAKGSGKIYNVPQWGSP